MSVMFRPAKYLRNITIPARCNIALRTARSLSALLCNHQEHNSSTKWARQYASQTPASIQPASIQPLLSRLDEEVRRFGRITRKDMEELLMGVRAHDLNSAQSLLVIRCCGDLVPEETPENRTKFVQQIWTALNERNVPVDISHYNALLRVYLENEHQFSPAEFLDELEKRGVQPNRVTYQRLMWRYCQAGDVEGATRVLEKMRELSLPVSEPVLNALVMGHAFHGDPEGAKAVLETMAGAGLQPSGRTYSLLASGHARSGHVDAAEEVLKLATDRDTILTNKDVLDVVESAALGGREDALDRLLQLTTRGAGYNQEARNLILRLINRGLDNAAIKVQQTMTERAAPEGQDPSVYRGAFFVKQLVRSRRPADRLVETCRRLRDLNLVPSAMLVATEAAITSGDTETAVALFRELRADGQPVRQHYYWPLLAAAGRAADEETLLSVLRAMTTHDLQPAAETLEDYVVPYLLGNNEADAAVIKLQAANVTVARAAKGVVAGLLNRGDVRDAARVAAQYAPRGGVASLTRPLLNGLSKAKDVESFAKILHALIGTKVQEDDSQDVEKENDRGEANAAVMGAVKILKDPAPVESLLDALKQRGIGIGDETAKKIEEYLGERMTAGVSEKLAALSSPELERTPAERVGRPRGVQLPAAALETLLQRARETGKPTALLSRQLLAAYVDADDEPALTALLQRLESEDFVLNGSTLGQLVEFYSRHDLERALAYRARLVEREPDFLLSKPRVIRLALALVKADRAGEALELLKAPSRDRAGLGENFVYNNLCWQLLNHLAENKGVQEVRVMLDALLEQDFADPSTGLLGTLVKAHIVRDDLDAAIEEFERCCHTYRCTPWKGEILRRLVEREDAARLQRVTDVATRVHGEVNSLHDLALAFVECGRLRQARRVLDTPGLRSRSQRLAAAAHRYAQEGKTEYLESLVEATKELTHIDRSEMYYNLLVSYCRADAADKALSLWTQLQEQGEAPTERFLVHLATYLRERGLDVPFVVPEPKVAKPTSAPTEKLKSEEVTKKYGAPSTNLDDELMAAIQANNLGMVTSALERAVKHGMLSRMSYAQAINFLINNNKVEEAAEVMLKALSQQTLPLTGVSRRLLAVLADAGDERRIAQIGQALSEKQRVQLQYDNKVGRACVARGGGEALLTSLLEAVRAAPDAEAARTALAHFPRSDSLATVLADPKLYALCTSIVEVEAEKGCSLATCAVWQELVLAGRAADARAVWDKHLRDQPMISFRRIVQVARDRSQPAVLLDLITYLKENKHVTVSAYAVVYSALVNARTDTESALAHIKAALDSGVELGQLSVRALANVRDRAVAEGKEFPYEVPKKTPVGDARSN